MYKHGSVKKKTTILKIPLKTGLAVLFIAHPGKNKKNKLCGFSQKGPIKRFGYQDVHEKDCQTCFFRGIFKKGVFLNRIVKPYKMH